MLFWQADSKFQNGRSILRFFRRSKSNSVPESRLSMAKRGLQDVDDEMDTKARFGHRRIKEDEDVEMGEFEDPWEDELEEEDEDGEEEIIVEGDEEDDEDEGII